MKQRYNLSNAEVAYQAHDRASFRRFRGLCGAAEIPDATTLDGFEQRLSQANLIDALFEQFAAGRVGGERGAKHRCHPDSSADPAQQPRRKPAV